jgi:hypothetical protein
MQRRECDNVEGTDRRVSFGKRPHEPIDVETVLPESPIAHPGGSFEAFAAPLPFNKLGDSHDVSISCTLARDLRCGSAARVLCSAGG